METIRKRQPLARAMPGLCDSSVPAADRQHPLIAQQTFYTLPLGLWKAAQSEIGRQHFDADDLALELRLSELCGDHTFQIGFRNGLPILFNRLRNSPLSSPKPDCDEWRQKSDVEWRACLRELSNRSSHFASMVRGYLGWLLTNPLFLDEHDRLFDKATQELPTISIPQMSEARCSGNQLPDGWERQSVETGNIAADFRDFCARWQLTEFAGPYLPKPIEVRISNPFAPNAGAPQFQLPATIAIDGKGLVRELISDCQRQSVGDHLREWLEIIGPDNQGRKSLYRYERIFELQHFGRILAVRHPAALAGNKERLRAAFAAFFKTSADSIRDDLRTVKARLSRGHCHAPAWLDVI